MFSRDGTGAIVQAQITGDGEAETILDPVDAVRERVSDPGGGLETKVTGPGRLRGRPDQGLRGHQRRAARAPGCCSCSSCWRSSTAARSSSWIPLLAIVFAEFGTRALGYGLTEAGVTVNGQSSAILSILVLGVGTDYALLLVARYREELRRHEDKHEAMALALRTAGPAIFASGMTVIAALLCLMLADVNGTSGLGPIGALGVAVAMVAMLTLLPAWLVIWGRRAFWPRIPHFGSEGVDETHGAWRRVGDRVASRPRRVWVGTVAAAARPRAGAAELRHRPDERQRVPRRRRGRRRPGAARQVLPERLQRADGHHRARPGAGRRRAHRGRRGGRASSPSARSSRPPRTACCSPRCSSATRSRPRPSTSSPGSARPPSARAARRRSSAAARRSSTTCVRRRRATTR